MKESTKKIYDELFDRYPVLVGEKQNVLSAFALLRSVYLSDKKLLLCGNGGSASDCEHIAGELIKSFKKKRPLEKTDEEKLTALGEDGATLANVLERGLKTVSLTSHLALSTAFANDKEPLATFAQQLYVLGDEGDALLCLSTSGNSQNCVYAALTAKAKGIKTLAITGAKESRLSALCDVCIQAPETETYKVQELHLPIYHCLCAMLEEEIF